MKIRNLMSLLGAAAHVANMSASTLLFVLASVALLTMNFFAIPAQAQKPAGKVNATALEAGFNSTEDEVTVSFTFTNGTARPMYLTDDGSPEVKTVHFEPTETCVLISKLLKPAAGQLDVPVKGRRVNPGKKFAGKMSWKIPFHHSGDLPKGWSKDDKPTCKNLRFEIAAIPGYDDLKPTPANDGGSGKDYYLLSKEARRHQETQTAESEGFEIPILLQ